MTRFLLERPEQRQQRHIPTTEPAKCPVNESNLGEHIGPDSERHSAVTPVAPFWLFLTKNLSQRNKFLNWLGPKLSKTMDVVRATAPSTGIVRGAGFGYAGSGEGDGVVPVSLDTGAVVVGGGGGAGGPTASPAADQAVPVVDLNESIDYGLVYARHTFVANLEGQVCVLKGDALDMLDDSNSYWWLVKCIKTDEIGYIPAENVETPFERLARLNSARNVQLATATQADFNDVRPEQDGRRLRFNEVPDVCEDYDEDYYDNDEDISPDPLSNPLGGPSFAASAANQDAFAQGSGRPGLGSSDQSDPRRARNQQGAASDFDAKTKSPPSNEVAYSGPTGGTRTQRASISLGQSLFQRLIKRNGTKNEKGEKTVHGSLQRDEFNRYKNAVNDQSPPLLEASTQPLNVLRIYAGNVDLKATFKTVSLTKSMTTLELLDQTLRRFRVPGSPVGEYYLSVIHMDSQERPIPEKGVVSEFLEGLRSKHLPGIGINSLSRATTSGRVSAVSLYDDNFLKVIINKKLNAVEKNFRIVRIVVYDEMDPSIRIFKTIALESDVTVKEMIEIAAKKLKISQKAYKFSLSSVFENKEILRDENEMILEVLKAAEQSSEEMIFILGKEPIPGMSESPEESDSPSRAKASSVNRGASPMNSSEASGASPSERRLYGLGDGRTLTPDLSPDSAGRKQSPPKAANGPPNQTWHPPTPPDENNGNNQVQRLGPVPSFSGDDTLGQGPIMDRVPPRKGSLVATQPLAGKAGGPGTRPRAMEATVTAVPASYGGRPKEAAPVSPPDKPLPEVPFSDAVAPPGAASAASMRSDIGVMEQYLQEMMVDAKDPRTGGARAPAQQMTTSPASRQRPEPNMATSVSRLRSAVAPNGLISPTSHPAGPRPLPTPTPSSSTAAAAAGQQSAALQGMYQDLERDLESLSAAAARAPQSVLVARASSAAPPAPPKSGSPEGAYAISPGPAGARKSSLTWNEPRSVTAAAAAAAAAVASAGAGALPAPPPPSVPPRSANPAVVDGDRPFDGEWALEKMKEVEMVLNTLQRDLDSICGKACQLAKLAHPNSAKASS
ncbi:hypothetical protein HK405_006455 [Cladochytrium tenue]|nr:hypothetical protein HK405_006455 [Cladochytrium tenue]